MTPSSDPATTSDPVLQMGFFSRLTGKLSPAGRSAREADRVFGTGLWRQHHDRFMRAVDRFYETAVALGREADSAADSAEGSAASHAADHPATERIAALTTTLNAHADAVTELTRRLHARWPLDGVVVPAQVRTACGPLPERLSQAATKASEAGQAAALTRIAVRTGQDPAAQCATAARFVDDVTALIEECLRLEAEAG